MARVIQAVAFFLLLGAAFALSAPYSGGAERLSILLAGGVVSVTLTYVLPWVYTLDTDPVFVSGE